jgi:hypothetical protein
MYYGDARIDQPVIVDMGKTDKGHLYLARLVFRCANATTTAGPVPATTAPSGSGPEVVRVPEPGGFLFAGSLLLILALVAGPIILVVIVVLIVSLARRTAANQPAAGLTASGEAGSPANPLSNGPDAKASRHGRLALGLCLFGLVFPVAMAVLCLLTGMRLDLSAWIWWIWIGVLVLTGLFALPALVMGIIGWKSRAGKAAVMAALVLPMLLVAGGVILYPAMHNSTFAARLLAPGEDPQVSHFKTDIKAGRLPGQNEQTAGFGPVVERVPSSNSGVPSPEELAAPGGLEITGPAEGFTQTQLRGWVEKRWRTEYPLETYQPLEWGEPQAIAPHGWVAIRVKYIYTPDAKSVKAKHFFGHRIYSFTKTGDFVRSDVVDGPEIPVDESQSAFGPVLERVLNDTSMSGGHIYFDFESGARTNDKPAGDSRLDLEVDLESGKERLIGLDWLAARVTESFWKDAPPTAVVDTLAHVIDKNAAVSQIRLSEVPSFPSAYLFRTRELTFGLLQIIGFTDNPRGLKVRYKLVTTQAPTAPIISGQAGSAANPIYVTCDRGETEAVLPHGGRLRLVAIGDQQQWWTPQGQPLPENPEWQRFRKNWPDSKHIAVVAQLHPEIDPAMAKIGPTGEQFEHPVLTAFGISPKPGERASLIVGLGAGPWQTASTVLSPAQTGVIKFGEAICGVEKIEEQIAGTPSHAPITLVSFWLMQPPELESALVAVGQDGREEALGLTWLAVDAARALPPGQRWDTSGFAHLDMARLELRTRPRAWAGFVGFATPAQGHRLELEKPNPTSKKQP